MCPAGGGKFGKMFKNRLGDKEIIKAKWQSPEACLERVAGHLARRLAIAGKTTCCTALSMTPPGSLRSALGDEEACAAALLAQGLNVGGDHRQAALETAEPLQYNTYKVLLAQSLIRRALSALTAIS